MRECTAAFWEGLTRPSLCALLVCVSTILCGVVAALLYLDEAKFAGDGYRFLMTSDQDNFALVTGRALKIRNAPASSFTVVILGTSTAIRCISSESELAELIAGETGVRPIVHDLCTDDQSVWEMAGLLDCVPAQTDLVLIVGVTAGILHNEQAYLADIDDNPRLGFRSGAFDAEVRRAGYGTWLRLGIYAIDNAPFLLARRWTLLQNFRSGGVPYGEPLDAPWMERVNTEEFWESEVAGLPQLQQRYSENKELNLEVIERFVLAAKERGRVVPVLMVSPINPRCFTEPSASAFLSRYKSDMRQFADRSAMHYFDVAEAAQLKASDFCDFEGHISNSIARRVATQAIASMAAELWMREFSKGE